MLMNNNDDYKMLFEIADDLFDGVSENDSTEILMRLDECSTSSTPDTFNSYNEFIKKACKKIKAVLEFERTAA